MAMLGLPMRYLGATILLGIFVVAPKVLTSFGITNDVIAFLIMPLVVFGLLIFIFCIYLATIVLNPVRFVIIIPMIILLAGVLTYGLYI